MHQKTVHDVIMDGKIHKKNENQTIEGHSRFHALDFARIYSGSWDMSIRIWDKAQLKCSSVLRHGDWVWSLTLCGSTVASSVGSDVHVWDTESREQVGVIGKAHVGNTLSVACSHSGDLLFGGGDDGAIAIHVFEVNNRCINDGIRSVATRGVHNRVGGLEP